MTDSTGTVVWSAYYKPFGAATVTVSMITNNLRFPGQYFDAESGLSYNYYRDYNPVIGRYLDADPIGIQKGRNHLYVYVNDHPLNSEDVYGLGSSGRLFRPMLPPIIPNPPDLPLPNPDDINQRLNPRPGPNPNPNLPGVGGNWIPGTRRVCVLKCQNNAQCTIHDPKKTSGCWCEYKEEVYFWENDTDL